MMYKYLTVKHFHKAARIQRKRVAFLFWKVWYNVFYMSM